MPNKVEHCSAGSILIAFVAITLVMPAARAEDTVEDFKSGFIGRLNNECLEKQRGAPENKNLAYPIIAQYCTCVSTHGAEVITMQDLFDDVAGRGRNLQMKLNALGKTCAEEISRLRQ